MCVQILKSKFKYKYKTTEYEISIFNEAPTQNLTTH